MAIGAGCLLGGGLIGGAVVGHNQNQQTQSLAQNAPVAEAENDQQQVDANQPGKETETDSGKHFSIEEATKKLGSDKQALSVAEIYKQASPSVVAVSTKGTATVAGYARNVSGSGSGVIISEDGYIVTNNHVIEGTSEITVETDDGKKYEAKLIGRDSVSDIAILKIEGTDFTAAVIGDSDTLEVGELAVAIGNPLGELTNSLTAGFISATNRSITVDNSGAGTQMNFIQTDVAISPGNSGGALINSYGELVGITTAKSTGDGVEGIGYAIPINDVMDIMEDLINEGRVTGRPYIGISVSVVDEETAQVYNWPLGLRVESVEENSTAANGGLMLGDIIVQINGEDILTYDDLNDKKADIQVGDSFTLTVYRKAEKVTLNLVMGERPGDDDTAAAQTEQSQQESQYGQQSPFYGMDIPPELEEQLEEYFYGR